MRKFFKYLFGFIGLIIVMLIIGFLVFHIYYFVINRLAQSKLVEKKELTIGGHTFRDLNNNGQLDIYEDSRRSVEDRVRDLIVQMTMEEKVGLMWHPPIGPGKDGKILGKPNPAAFHMVSTYNVVINQELRHFNLFGIPDTRSLALWYNNLQKLAESDRLGIPVSISSDPRHGIRNFIGNDLLGGDFSKWPEPIGLAATGDSALVVEFGRIAADELRSVGIRTALHPMADLATEPRWARINGTFGEDADLSARITAAYINGFQGEQIGPHTVACMTKHWPGGGPQKDGWDAHFRYGADQAYPGNNFDYHLKPFDAAFNAGTLMIMPYYGIPVGQTPEDVGMAFNEYVIKNLLREEYNYDGIVCSDWGVIEGFKILGIPLFESTGWGVDELSVKEKIAKAIDAGLDQFGGNSNTRELIRLVKDGRIAEERIDRSVSRLLTVKFQIGLFDNPYVDVENALNTVGKKEYVELGKRAQRKSIVLMKNSISSDNLPVLPLRDDVKIYVENIDADIGNEYARVVDNLEEADLAILRLQTPFEPRDGNFFESMFHQGYLDFKEPELSRILQITQTKPTIISMYLDRPAVIPEITENAVAVLGDFGTHDDALMDIIFGIYSPSGKLPFELPSSMTAVENQFEDVPYDTEDPLFPFGHGLTYPDSSLNTLLD